MWRIHVKMSRVFFCRVDYLTLASPVTPGTLISLVPNFDMPHLSFSFFFPFFSMAMLLQVSRIKIQQESTYSQTLRYDQYLTHAHSHITLTVAVNSKHLEILLIGKF